MKLVLISDIHLDINNKRKDPNFDEKLIQYLNGLNADGIIIAGDIAGSTSDIVKFFEKVQNLPFEYKVFVPGNHDIWVNQNAVDLSSVKYYQILGEIADKFDIYYLPQNPLILDNVAILGTMGWYDYSSRNKIWDDQVSMQDYARKKHPKSNLELMDRHFVKFGLSDEEISKMMINDLSNDFEFISNRVDPGEIDNLVCVSHMVPFKEFIPYRGLLKYDYFTAFFGNFNLGDLIHQKSADFTIHSVFGQCHIPRSKRLHEDLYGYCVPIGYPREYGHEIELNKLFKNRVYEINV